MADTVDGLVIEIESTSNGTAGAQLEALARNLETLKKAVSGSTPLNTFSKNYQELINTINTSQVDVTRLEGLRAVSQVVRSFENVKTGNSQVRSFAKNYVELANSINSTDINTVKLEGLRAFGQVTTGFNSIKISPSIARQLNNLYTVMESMSVQGTENLLKMSTSLSSLNGVKISPSVGNQLERIAKFAQSIEGQNYTSLNSLIDALNRIQFVGAGSAENLKTVSTSLKQTASAARTATSSTKKFNTVLANIRVRTLALVRVTQMITRATTKALSVYGDYVETLNLFKMAMGEAGSEAYEFAEKCQELLGIDLTQWMKAQGVFNSLAVGFGIASDKAAVMSQNLTQLAYDISSFYNIDVDSAIEKVRSGFSGQIRPVRDLGYDLSQVKLEAIAVSLGIDKSVKSMTQAEKSQLRYIALMTQLTHVQGDLSRTLNSPINQMRILQAQLEQMYRAIGLTLLPILNKVLPYLNAILRVIKMIAMEIAEMFGIVLPTLSGETVTSNLGVDVEDLTDDLEDATGAAEKLKNTLASFDQINLITSSSGGSGGSGSTATVGGDLDIDLPTYDFLGDAAENKAQEIAEKMMKSLRPAINMIEDAIKFTVDNLDHIGYLLLNMAVVTIGKKLIDNIMGAVKWFNELNDIVKGIGLVVIGVQLAYLGGKDIASGNFWKGIIETFVGSGLAAYGGYLLLGPAGLVAGLTIGLAFAFEAYETEKSKQFHDYINDVAFGFDHTKGSLDDLSTTWTTFAEKFSNTEFLSKYSSATRDEISNIGIGIAQLQLAYSQGLIGTDYYCQELANKFGDLKETVLGYLDESRQAITDQLNGALGAFLLTLGYTQAEINEMLDASTQNITNDFDELSKKVEDARAKFEAGGSEEEYKQTLEEVASAIEEYFGATGTMSKSLQEFNGTMDTLKNGVNLESLDDTLRVIGEINKGYDDAIDSITKEREETLARFNLFSNKIPPEYRERFEGMIEGVNTFFNQQEEAIRTGYAETMGTLEREAVGRWDTIWDRDGLKGVSTFYMDSLKSIGEAFDESFKDRPEITRTQTGINDIMETMKAYEPVVALVSRNSSLLSEKMKGDVEERLRNIRKTHISMNENTREAWNKEVENYKNGTSEVNKVTDEQVKDLYKRVNISTDNISSIFGKLPQSMNENIISSSRELALGKVAFENTTRSAMQAINNAIATGNAPEEMKRIMAKMNDAIKPDEFGQKGTSLKEKFLTGFKKDFTPVTTINDFKDTISRMLSGEDAKKWGEQIGVGVKFGISDGLSGTEQGVTNALQGAKTVLNNFGYASAQYWAQMSANIIAVMSALMKNPTSTANASLQAILKGMTWNMKGFAQGGFPDSADFFYANENGVPEYVGSMGGRTAVANNNDIVKGISNGVVRAITSTGIQNDVRKLASKSNTVVFAPSAEAGRVMTQSVNLYNQTGGRR